MVYNGGAPGVLGGPELESQILTEEKRAELKAQADTEIASLEDLEIADQFNRVKRFRDTLDRQGINTNEMSPSAIISRYYQLKSDEALRQAE